MTTTKTMTSEINEDRMNKSIAIDYRIEELLSIQERMTKEAVAEKAQSLIINGYNPSKVYEMSDERVIKEYQYLLDGNRGTKKTLRTITIAGTILLLSAMLGMTSCATSGESVHNIYGKHGYCNDTTCVVKELNEFGISCPVKDRVEYDSTIESTYHYRYQKAFNATN